MPSSLGSEGGAGGGRSRALLGRLLGGLSLDNEKVTLLTSKVTLLSLWFPGGSLSFGATLSLGGGPGGGRWRAVPGAPGQLTNDVNLLMMSGAGGTQQPPERIEQVLPYLTPAYPRVPKTKPCNPKPRGGPGGGRLRAVPGAPGSEFRIQG